MDRDMMVVDGILTDKTNLPQKKNETKINTKSLQCPNQKKGEEVYICRDGKHLSFISKSFWTEKKVRGSVDSAFRLVPIATKIKKRRKNTMWNNTEGKKYYT